MCIVADIILEAISIVFYAVIYDERTTYPYMRRIPI